jgi:hypothetical protein
MRKFTSRATSSSSRACASSSALRPNGATCAVRLATLGVLDVTRPGRSPGSGFTPCMARLSAISSSSSEALALRVMGRATATTLGFLAASFARFSCSSSCFFSAPRAPLNGVASRSGTFGSEKASSPSSLNGEGPRSEPRSRPFFFLPIVPSSLARPRASFDEG